MNVVAEAEQVNSSLGSPYTTQMITSNFTKIQYHNLNIKPIWFNFILGIYLIVS